MRSKHILFIVENNSVPGDVRVWNEVRAAKEFGYEVSVICPKREKTPKLYERIEGVHIYRHFCPVEAGRTLAFLVEYANAVVWEFLLSVYVYFRRRFHIIHSANPPDMVFLIAVLYKVLGVRYVFDHHDISPENYVAKFGRKDFIYSILLLMERLTFKVADVVISTNESYKKIALERGSKISGEVFVVRNGPNLKNVIRMPPSAKRKQGFAYLVVYVGTIGNQEGIDHLLNAVKYIVRTKRRNDIKFTIVGAGTHWSSLVSLSREMQIDQFVEFSGYVPYEDFYEIIASSDLCVNPEHRNDFTDKSTMIKIMDYMTFGKPIVMFETMEGRVTAGDSAWYVKDNNDDDFAEAILMLLQDEGKRKIMGDFGRRRVEECLQWDRQKDNLKQAYQYLEVI